MKPKSTNGGDEAPPKPKRRLNKAQKRALKTAEIAVFLKQFGRKAQKRVEPNDRRYSHELESKLKAMPADLLDRLMREDEDGAS